MQLKKDEDTLDLCNIQIRQFIENNLDPETNLPYHGYYENGSKRLGLHGWGRGTCWNMMGLIDTILELDDSHPDLNTLTVAYKETANRCMNSKERTLIGIRLCNIDAIHSTSQLSA